MLRISVFDDNVARNAQLVGQFAAPITAIRQGELRVEGSGFKVN
jgi:hypothetical protein